MIRLLLVVCAAPAFALLLIAAIGTSIALGRRDGRAEVTALAPVLYALVVLAAAATAAALVGFRLRELSFEPGWDGPLRLPAAVAGGLALGVLAFLGELAVSERRVRRAVAAPVASQPTGIQAVRLWGASPGMLIGLGLVTAVAEETLFRGYLLTGLRGSMPLAAAIAVQAAVFGAHHGSFGWRAIPAKFVHGVVWGAATAAAGSLVPALAAHAVFQVLACRRLVRHRQASSAGGEVRGAAQRSAVV